VEQRLEKSCIPVWTPSFLMRLITQLSPTDFDLFPKLKKPIRGKRFRSIEEVSNEVI
jgi:hypothetical protein